MNFKNKITKTLSVLLAVVMMFGLLSNTVFAASSVKSEVTGLGNTNTGVKVSFTRVDNAESYTLYRKTESTDWVALKTIPQRSYSYYVDEAAKSGEKYFYSISVTVNNVTSDFDKVGKSIIFLDSPKFNISNNSSSNSAGIFISFENVTGAESYQILRKDKVNNNFKAITNVGSNGNYIDKTVSVGTEYTYAVRACKSGSLSYIYSKTIVVYPQPSLANVQTGVKVSYTKMDGAVEYQLYRRTATTDWVKISSTTPKTWYYFVDSTAISGELYYYSVRVIGDGFDTGVDNTGSLTMFIASPELNVSKNGSCAVIDFKYVNGASSYQILRKDLSGSSYKSIGTVDKNHNLYIDSSAVSGNQYTYAVRATNDKYYSYINSFNINM